jgi:hypothetical protein
MRSTAESAQADPRDDSMRFRVSRTEHGYEIEVVGQDPDTRYVPRDKRTLWRRIVDRLKLGLRSIRDFGPSS